MARTIIAPPLSELPPAASTIVQRRIQMFIHSYLYYVLDRPIVSDHQWQAWANELRMLQRNHPKLAIHFYDEDFADWDGSTGMHLPQYVWIVDRAHHLLHLHERADLRAGHLAEDPAKDINVRIERTQALQIEAAHQAGRQAGLDDKPRHHPPYRKRIEVDAWLQGFDETTKQPGQIALF